MEPEIFPSLTNTSVYTDERISALVTLFTGVGECVSKKFGVDCGQELTEKNTWAFAHPDQTRTDAFVIGCREHIEPSAKVNSKAFAFVTAFAVVKLREEQERRNELKLKVEKKRVMLFDRIALGLAIAADKPVSEVTQTEVSGWMSAHADILTRFRLEIDRIVDKSDPVVTPVAPTKTNNRPVANAGGEMTHRLSIPQPQTADAVATSPA